jgi:hypothetical protein
MCRRLIHPSARKGFSPNSACKIVHRTRSYGAENARRPRPGAERRSPHVVEPHRDALACVGKGPPLEIGACGPRSGSYYVLASFAPRLNVGVLQEVLHFDLLISTMTREEALPL